MRGIDRSMSTTSGRCSQHGRGRLARRPRPRRRPSMSSTAHSRSVSPRRTTGWSSTSRTRITPGTGSGDPARDAELEPRARPPARSGPRGCRRAAAPGRRAGRGPGCRAGRRRGPGAKPPPSSLICSSTRVVVRREAHRDAAGAGVAQDVAHRLLRRAQDQVDDRLVDVRRRPPTATPHVEPAVLERCDQVLEAREQRLASQPRRRDRHDEAAQLADRPPQVHGHPVQDLARPAVDRPATARAASAVRV